MKLIDWLSSSHGITSLIEIGFLLHISFRVGEFVQRVKSVEKRVEKIEENMPLRIVRGGKK